MGGRVLRCPGCGEDEELTGAPTPDGIRLTCDRCGESWLRDTGPARCATCGGEDLEERPQALTQYSRGNQLSIVGFRRILLCATCDARMLAWSVAGRAVPFHYRPAAMDPDANPQEDDGTGDIQMTPQ